MSRKTMAWRIGTIEPARITGAGMKGCVHDIETIATGNGDFRRVLYTARKCQLVAMSLKPEEVIGAEVHELDRTALADAGHPDRRPGLYQPER